MKPYLKVARAVVIDRHSMFKNPMYKGVNYTWRTFPIVEHVLCALPLNLSDVLETDEKEAVQEYVQALWTTLNIEDPT